MTKISNKNNYKKNVTFKNKNKNKKMQKTLEGGGEGEEETIIVLSWNIFWMAMDGINEDDPRQKGKKPTPQSDFGKHCATKVEDGLNICATNVKTTIDELAKEYDFVALQEASQWNKIHEKSTNLKGMGYVHYKFGNTNLVTFYNKKKYRLIAFKTDFISKIIDIKADTYNNRPYHVLYLEHIKSKEHYIFINLHLPHEINRFEVESGLSKNMDTFFMLNKDDGNISETFSTHPTEENRNDTQAYFQTQRAIDKQTTPIIMTWSEQKYNIIVAGDFNDKREHTFWSSLKPLQYYNTKGQNLLDIEVKLQEEPPHTCCSLNFDTSSKNKYTSIGDYILVNSNLKVKKINAPTLTIPTSDHLPVIIHLSPTYNKEDDATKLDPIKPPAASLDAAIIPAPDATIIPAASPEAAPPEAAPETSLVLANALIHEEKKPEECVPKIIHVLKIEPDGNCLFSSLFTGLIRLNANIDAFSAIPIHKDHEGDVQAFVAKHIHTFRKIIVDSLEIFLKTNIDTLVEGIFIEMGRFEYKDEDTIDLTDKSIRQDIVTSYITNMRRASIWGDQIIIIHFIRMTNINVVIFNFLPSRRDKDGNRIFTISGNLCYDGIWLYYNGSSHYDLIFPINVDRKFDIISDTPHLSYKYNDFKEKIKTHTSYKHLLAITTIKENMIEQVAKPGPAKPAEAKPAEAQAKPAPAKVKPANLTKVKPVKSAKANPTPVPVPVKPANPAHTQDEEAALRRAGASRVSTEQAQTKVEGQSEGQNEGQSEGQIQAPTQAPTEVEGQNEEQIGEVPTRGDAGETNQIFKPDESNSGNMFVIPLMGVVLALAITFLVKK